MQVHHPIQKEPKAFEELKHRDDIVKTNADKGYIKESERQLNDTKHYRNLQHNPTIKTLKKLIPY